MSRQLPWMRDVRVGDVLTCRSGDMRVVRHVHRRKNGDLGSLTFAIRACSWTHRCYTVLNAVDLVQRRFRPVGVRLPLRSRLDAKIRDAIEDKGNRRLDCCAVRGVP